MKKLLLATALVLTVTPALAGAYPWPRGYYPPNQRGPTDYWEDQEGYIYPRGDIYQNPHYRRNNPQWYGNPNGPNWWGYPGPP